MEADTAFLGACGVLTGLVVADVLAKGPLTALDHWVHGHTDRLARGAWFGPAHTVHLLGQRWVLLLVIVPLMAVAAWRSRSWRPVLVTVALLAALTFVQDMLKSVLPRSYPMSGQDVLFAKGDAFPSGHTINALVLVWVALELLVLAWPAAARSLTPEHRVGVALTTGLITAVGVTLADYHWLTDALASLAFGPLILAYAIAADPFGTTPAVRSHQFTQFTQSAQSTLGAGPS